MISASESTNRTSNFVLNAMFAKPGFLDSTPVTNTTKNTEGFFILGDHVKASLGSRRR